ncbi:hypothetical protein D6D20_07475 [Aureobasidium pullulans]|uniref:BTB domain-containing protein n=1 Tax=Aureobasidium pullulans TaxID=5580 RepID=A0A4S9ZC29_AURPU|nr:hypothetical protein D6D20_07475 [Aureobasidium pullulans]TIA02045.1 hypothetical protein D6C82_03146 [Aureobasidium pullulans]
MFKNTDSQVTNFIAHQTTSFSFDKTMAPIITKYLTEAELPHYYNNESLSNVVLHFGNKTIFAHKKLLAARGRGSRVLRNEFKENSPFAKAVEYTIEGHDEEIIEVMIRHIYGFQYDNTLVRRNFDTELAKTERLEWLISVYLIAVEYRVPSLSILVTDKLVGMLSEGFHTYRSRHGDKLNKEQKARIAESKQVLERIVALYEQNALPDKLTWKIKPYELFHKAARQMVQYRSFWVAELCGGSDERYTPFAIRMAWWFARIKFDNMQCVDCGFDEEPHYHYLYYGEWPVEFRDLLWRGFHEHIVKQDYRVGESMF